jgi:hypothetical protein
MFSTFEMLYCRACICHHPPGGGVAEAEAVVQFKKEPAVGSLGTEKWF